MSGTSLDGVDIAHCKLWLDGTQWNYEIIHAETIPYSKEWIDALVKAIDSKQNQLLELDKDYTHYLGKLITNFYKKHDIQFIDAVCSHGHTILHQPREGSPIRWVIWSP